MCGFSLFPEYADGGGDGADNSATAGPAMEAGLAGHDRFLGRVAVGVPPGRSGGADHDDGAPTVVAERARRHDLDFATGDPISTTFDRA